MEKIRINDVTYDILAIGCPAGNLLQIAFGQLPENIEFTGTIELLTEGEELCASFEGFRTVYRSEDNIVTLSNDGSVYTEPVPEPDPVEPEPTEEQKKEQERLVKVAETESRIAAIDAEFRTLDYIGIKIATGRATISDYEPEIARMTKLADEKNELETELTALQEESKEVQ